MNERSTGATDAEIEAAENRCEEGGQFNAVWIRDLAGYLVPPDTRIVPVSPVRADPALVEANEILDWVIGVASWENADAHDALLRLRSALFLIADGRAGRTRVSERSTGATDEQAFIEAATVLTGILESYPEFDELNADSTAEVIVDDLGKRGYAIVPVSPVRADPALVEAERERAIHTTISNWLFDHDIDVDGDEIADQMTPAVLAALAASARPDEVKAGTIP